MGATKHWSLSNGNATTVFEKRHASTLILRLNTLLNKIVLRQKKLCLSKNWYHTTSVDMTSWIGIRKKGMRASPISFCRREETGFGWSYKQVSPSFI